MCIVQTQSIRHRDTVVNATRPGFRSWGKALVKTHTNGEIPLVGSAEKERSVVEEVLLE